MQRQQFRQGQAGRRVVNALQQIGGAQWSCRWRDLGELRQCGVARWLENKWVCFIFQSNPEITLKVISVFVAFITSSLAPL